MEPLGTRFLSEDVEMSGQELKELAEEGAFNNTALKISWGATCGLPAAFFNPGPLLAYLVSLSGTAISAFLDDVCDIDTDITDAMENNELQNIDSIKVEIEVSEIYSLRNPSDVKQTTYRKLRVNQI